MVSMTHKVNTSPVVQTHVAVRLQVHSTGRVCVCSKRPQWLPCCRPSACRPSETLLALPAGPHPSAECPEIGGLGGPGNLSQLLCDFRKPLAAACGPACLCLPLGFREADDGNAPALPACVPAQTTGEKGGLLTGFPLPPLGPMTRQSAETLEETEAHSGPLAEGPSSQGWPHPNPP